MYLNLFENLPSKHDIFIIWNIYYLTFQIKQVLIRKYPTEPCKKEN